MVSRVVSFVGVDEELIREQPHPATPNTQHNLKVPPYASYPTTRRQHDTQSKFDISRRNSPPINQIQHFNSDRDHPRRQNEKSLRISSISEQIVHPRNRQYINERDLTQQHLSPRYPDEITHKERIKKRRRNDWLQSDDDEHELDEEYDNEEEDQKLIHYKISKHSRTYSNLQDQHGNRDFDSQDRPKRTKRR